MTLGHKHHLIKAKRHGLVVKILTNTPVWYSRNLPWVDRSRFPFKKAKLEGWWKLTVLGFSMVCSVSPYMLA